MLSYAVSEAGVAPRSGAGHDEREALALALAAVEARSGAPARVLRAGHEEGRPVFELREALGTGAGGRRYRVAVDPALGVALVTPLG